MFWFVVLLISFVAVAVFDRVVIAVGVDVRRSVVGGDVVVDG